MKRHSFLKKCLSFFKPILIDRFTFDDIEYQLELYKNKVLLNTQNANQSNGSLYLAFKLLFENYILIPKYKTLNVLILGYGLGSVDQIFTFKNQNVRITGVEKNINLKPWMFGLKKQIKTQIFFDDVMLFINQNIYFYDYIIVDLFDDTEIPESIYQLNFWKKLYSSLNYNGVIIWNILQKKHQLDIIKGFIFDKKINVLTGNEFLIKIKDEF